MTLPLQTCGQTGCNYLPWTVWDVMPTLLSIHVEIHCGGHSRECPPGQDCRPTSTGTIDPHFYLRSIGLTLGAKTPGWLELLCFPVSPNTSSLKGLEQARQATHAWEWSLLQQWLAFLAFQHALPPQRPSLIVPALDIGLDRWNLSLKLYPPNRLSKENSSPRRCTQAIQFWPAAPSEKGRAFSVSV